MKNMFNETMKVYTGEESINEAWRYAEDLKQSAIAGDYLRVTPEALAEFVRSAVMNLDEYNMCSVLRGLKMPADARADMIYHTSYAVTAAGIYLIVNHPHLISDDETEAFAHMMDAAFCHGIIIHGYDDDGLENKLLAMFGLAGAKHLISKKPEFSPSFTERMKQHLDVCDRAAWEENSTGVYVKSGGFNTDLQNLALRWVNACWHGKPNAVFTYGTLMRGQRADDYMASAIWGGNCYLKGYAMYDLGSFPGIKKKIGECVLGELWFVDDSTLKALDRYEGEGSLYLRKQVTIESAYGPLKANAYIYNHPCSGDVLREKWGAKDSDYVWYAAYGSNLCAERFSCYIQGGTCSANKRYYSGCDDKRLWTDEYFTSVDGHMYFGKESGTWGGGVAFFNRNARGSTIVRLYRITRSQLMGVRAQEGASPEWYGRIECLGVERNGEPIYTLTSESVHKCNKPSDAYLTLIKNALITEGHLSEKDASRYLKGCMR